MSEIPEITSFNIYQELAHKTSKNTKINGSKRIYPAYGLPDEIGEVFGKFKKFFRDKGEDLSEEFRLSLIKEVGDIAWYIQELATQYGVLLDDLIPKEEVETLLNDNDSVVFNPDITNMGTYYLVQMMRLGLEVVALQADERRCSDLLGSTEQVTGGQSAIEKIIGIQLMFLSDLCKALTISLKEVLTTNVEKLYDRQKRNVIGGDGDNR